MEVGCLEVKLGCMTRPYAKYAVERAFEGIARAGYKYTAFLGAHPDGGAYDLDTPLSQSIALRKRMASFGLTPVTAWAGNPVQYGVEGMRRHVEIAAELGLEYIIISSPYLGKNESLSQAEVKSRFISVVEPVLPLCAQVGVRLDIKPHMGPYGQGAGLRELATAIDHPCFGISYDPGNIHYYEGLVPENDLDPVAEMITSLCVKDHKGAAWENNFPTPGDNGDVDWPHIFKLLGKGNFSGYALIEVMTEENDTALDNAGIRVRARLETWITEAGGKVVE